MHTEETKRKIRETNILRAKERGPEWNKMMKAINNDPEKIAKNKETWKKKRKPLHEVKDIGTVRRYLLEDVTNCECCGLENWMGEKIPLEIHHKDGNKKNNYRENIDVLCCNCHAQTDNWRGKK